MATASRLPSLQRLVGKLCKQFLYKSSIDINRHMAHVSSLWDKQFNRVDQKAWSLNSCDLAEFSMDKIQETMWLECIVELFDGNILTNALSTINVASSWFSQSLVGFCPPNCFCTSNSHDRHSWNSSFERHQGWVGCHAMERLAYTCHLEGTEIGSGYLKCSFYITLVSKG